MKKIHKIFGFIALAIAMFMGTLDTTIINIALPDITDYFNASLNDTSWISTIYVLSLSVFMITASKIADQFGRKKVMIIGLILFGGSSALCGLSSSLMFLIVMRGIQGIGGAIITPLVVPMALATFGKEKTAVLAGAIGAITALAAAGGPPIGGLLVEYVNWQAIFYINVPFALIAIILAIFFQKESYDQTASKSIDWAGIILLSTTLFLLTFALLKGNDYGWSSILIVSMFIGSAVSLILFIFTELKVKAPMMELPLFREITFTTSTICYLITGFGIVVPGLIFNYFLQNVMGYSPLHAAIIVTPLSLTVIVSMPLGSLISKKMDARIVNFMGIFGMGVSAFTLSRLTINASEALMTGEMVLFGFALGFSVQALVSSIKYIPEEKSGMGSGIVNAARQIGTCIGIAILVSLLTTYVTDAKNDIKRSALEDINNHKNIAEPVRKIIVDSINKNMKNSDNMQQNDIKADLEKDIKNALKKLSAVTKPENNDVLNTLYDGVSSLSNGVDKTFEGQQNLGKGIENLNSGLKALNDGSNSLTTGLGTLNSGFTKVLEGSQQLKTTASQGSSALTSAVNQLDLGAQSLLSQFSKGSDADKPTIYDAVERISGGAQNLSTNTDTYISAVNNTIFTLIKNNPASDKLLAGYKGSLAKVMSAYKNADTSGKQKYLQQIQMLTNLVNLYTVGTDASVTTAAQFEAKLIKLSQQNNNNATVVSSGTKVKTGTIQLTNASQKVASQFSDGGSFKTGVAKLAGGTGKLKEQSGKLSLLNEGAKKLSDSLSKLKDASSKLYAGSRNLQDGIKKVQNGGINLKAGSDKLLDATGQIKDGSEKLIHGVGLAGQQYEIKSIMDKLSSNKDEKVTGAFKKTFLIGAIILMLVSVCGFFTDKGAKTVNKSDGIQMD